MRTSHGYQSLNPVKKSSQVVPIISKTTTNSTVHWWPLKIMQDLKHDTGGTQNHLFANKLCISSMRPQSVITPEVIPRRYIKTTAEVLLARSRSLTPSCQSLSGLTLHTSHNTWRKGTHPEYQGCLAARNVSRASSIRLVHRVLDISLGTGLRSSSCTRI